MKETEAEREARRDSRGGRIGIALLLMFLAAGVLGVWARMDNEELGALPPLLIGLGLAIVTGFFVMVVTLRFVWKEAGKGIERMDTSPATRAILGIGAGVMAWGLSILAGAIGLFVLLFVVCAVGGVN